MDSLGSQPYRSVTPTGRVLAAVTAAALLVPLAIACLLVPDGSGYGTHRQLGLPPCTILALTGVRCPTCGMTTAWSHVARGRIRAAVSANIGGAMLAVAAIVAVCGLTWTAVLGRRPRWLPDTNTAAWGLTAIAVITLIDWAVRLLPS